MSRISVIVPISVLFILVSLSPGSVKGALRRCFQCRSRGDLGSCKDPFNFNATTAEHEQGVQAIPCASGWCGKINEGTGSYKQDDYGMATQRMCLPRGPSDREERCAYTVWGHSKVYMCFCRGDLCNKATQSTLDFNALLLTAMLSAMHMCL